MRTREREQKFILTHDRDSCKQANKQTKKHNKTSSDVLERDN